MTKTEIEKKIYEIKRIIESCENIIKANENEIKKLEAEKEKTAFERVEEGKKYYVVTTAVSHEGVVVKEYIEEHLRFDKSNFENNNYFLTKERAEEVGDKINFLLKLERLYDTFCPDYKADWEDDWKQKFYIFFLIMKLKCTEAPVPILRMITQQFTLIAEKLPKKFVKS